MCARIMSLIAAVAFCACSGPDAPIDATDTGSDGDDAAIDLGDVSPGTGDDAGQPEPDAGADAGPEDIAAAVARYAAARCDARANCPSMFFFDLFHGKDVAACTAAFIERTRWLDEPGATTTAADFDACAAALAGRTCEVELPPECLFSGSLAVGEPCTDAALCDSGLCAFSGDGATCGVCVSPDAEGDPCREWTSEAQVAPYCLGGLACGADGTCHTPAPIGESCGPRPCEFWGECMDGQCVAQGVAGDACDPADPTVPQCRTSQGFFCDRAAGVCFRPEIQDIGETCGTSFEDIFCRASVCVPNANGDAFVCSARVAEGAPCDELRHNCQSGLVCSEGVCTPLSCEM